MIDSWKTDRRFVPPKTSDPRPPNNMFGGARAMKGVSAAFLVLSALLIQGCQASTGSPGPKMPDVCPQEKLPADITPPTLITRVEPDPRDAHGVVHHGLVCAKGTLSVDGVPKDIEITRHGDAVLERALIAAVSQWRYSPAIKDGKPVEIPISFSVESTRH